jgi:hypothetical protein
VVLVARSGFQTQRTERPLHIIASQVRSPRRLGGAWVDLDHHSEDEGVPFNKDLGRMTDRQWRQVVRAMHEVDQNLLVITMMFENYTRRGQHQIETEGLQATRRVVPANDIAERRELETRAVLHNRTTRRLLKDKPVANIRTFHARG